MRAEGTGLALVARTTRGERSESWHHGAVAVVTPRGRRVARAGDPAFETYLRSAAKPVQALPMLLSGAADRFALGAADLALVCASHGATEAHTARVRSILERGGFSAADLRCGPHLPMDETTAGVMVRSGLEPQPIHNNCSGKHAGMLLTCRHNGWDPETYLEADHPLQTEILASVADLAGLEPERIGLAPDGCSVPSFRISLEAAARIYAALADPAGAGCDEALRAALRRIAEAMTSEPLMVAGPGRFTTRLMEVCGGRIVGKEGAEGLYAVAVRGPVAMGVCVKIGDGSGRCRDGVVLEVLRQMGVLSGEELGRLAGYYRPPVSNCNGWTVGEIVPEVELEEE